MVDILLRQKYFLTLIFMTIVLYFMYFYIYLSVKYRFKFWKYSGKSITSPEFICKKITKCDLDGKTGYFDGNKQEEDDDSITYKFPNSSENHHILNIEKDKKATYSFLLYLNNMTSLDEKQIFELGTVVDNNFLFNVSHLNGNMKINIRGDENLLVIQDVIFNKWHHVVLSFDKNIIDVYINGELKQSNILEGDVFDGANPNYLKVFNFSGKIMKIRYFKYTFKPLDASLLYQYYKYINILDSGGIIEGGKKDSGGCEPFSPKIKMKKYNKTRIERKNIETLQNEFININSQMMS